MKKTALELLAEKEQGMIVDSFVADKCETHEVVLSAQEMLTDKGHLYRRTICPFANQLRCPHQETITLL